MTEALTCVVCFELLLIRVCCVHFTWDDNKESRDLLVRTLYELVFMFSLKNLANKCEVVNLLPWQVPKEDIIFQRYQYPTISLLIFSYLNLILILHINTLLLTVTKHHRITSFNYWPIGVRIDSSNKWQCAVMEGGDFLVNV